MKLPDEPLDKTFLFQVNISNFEDSNINKLHKNQITKIIKRRALGEIRETLHLNMTSFSYRMNYLFSELRNSSRITSSCFSRAVSPARLRFAKKLR